MLRMSRRWKEIGLSERGSLKSRFGIIPFLTALTLFSCELLYAAETKPGWQQEWERTVAAAKKEGRVNVYMSGWFAVLYAGVFQKAYPEIKVVGVTGPGDQVTQRVLSERRAGKYLADVVSAGVPFPYPQLYRAKLFDPITPALILPEVTDQSKWYQGRHRYADPEGQYVFIYTGMPQTGGASYNTKLVNPKEFKSFWDFVHPKWKGKIEARDIRVPGSGSGAMRFFYHHPELGPRFIRRLVGEMDTTLFRDPRLGSDWLATGKFALCFFCSTGTAKLQGLPVDTFGVMKEGAGLVSQFGGLGLVNKALHPNAAKVFINWYLSREGQMALQRVVAQAGDASAVPDSLRVDISKDDIPPEDRRAEGVRYLDLDTPGRIEMEAIYDVIKEALVKAGKL